MKFHITKPVWRVTCALTSSVLLMVSFQNCGKAGFDSSLDEGLSSASTNANLDSQFGQRDGAKVAAIPFAYDAIIDQITYNSCTGAALQQKPDIFFTFKVGAYSRGGIRVRQTFLDYLTTNFKPVYPETVLSLNQVKEYLVASPENTGTQPQFSIRTRGRPQVIRVPTNSSTANLGLDFFNLNGSLTNDRYMDPLLKAGTAPTRFFPLAINSTERTLESGVAYNSDEFLAKKLREDFRNTAQLAMSFTANGGDSFLARTTVGSTDQTKAYGRGYNLTFSVEVAPYTRIASGNTNAISRASNLNNILTSVQEVNLENPSVSSGAVWSCDPARRYVIVRASDAPTLCPPESIASMSNAAVRKELEIVRRHLASDSWDVNIAARCVVPKASAGTCYPSEVLNGATVQIEYDQTKECFSNAKDPENAATPATKRCAEYVSICTRESSN